MKVKALQPLYARAAGSLVQLASEFQERIYIQKDQHVADGKSLLGVVTLAVYSGQEVEIVCLPTNEIFYQRLFSLGIFQPVSVS